MGYQRNVVSGFSWLGGFRIFNRVVAFGRIAILARLLLPSQFGIFSISALILALLEVSTQTGINVFLIQRKESIDEYIDTAWVVSIIRGLFIAIIIFLSAPTVGRFFNSPESIGFLRLMSLVALVRGFINPSIIKFQKNLQFSKEFWLRSSIFIVETLVVVGLAFLTKSATSLVWGLVVAASMEAILSFILIKPRPTFSLEIKKTAEIVGRGKWVTASAIFNYLNMQGDDAVVGKMLNTASLGLYQVAYKISTLPLTEITEVASKVTFPVYVQISGDTKRLKRAFFRVLFTVGFMTIPIGLFLFMFPKQVVLIVLGENWLGAVGALRILAIYGVVRAISGTGGVLFHSVRRQEYVAVITFVRFFVMAATIFPLVNYYGIVGAGISALAASLSAIPFIIYFAVKVLSNKNDRK